MPGNSSLSLLKTATVALLAAGAFATLSSTAIAASLAERFETGACYSRAYSADHLGNHPQQLVARIWFVADPSLGVSPDGQALRFGFILRDGRRYDSVAYCRADASCATEGDGGRIQFTDRGPNLRMSIVDYLVVEGADFSPDLSQSDDRVFLLYPSNPAGCG